MTRDGQDGDSAKRVRAILADLLKRRLAESLSEVDSALASWRTGELSVFEAHGEVLRHVGRAEMVAEQVGRAEGDAASLLRQAFDSGIVGRGEFVELVGKPPEDVVPAPTEFVPSSVLPPKRQVVEELMPDGPILVHIDARAEGVSVPPRFAADPRLVLRFGYQLSPPIADLEVDDEKLAGTLTFSGVPHRCFLPWSAIYAVVGEADQEGMVWPDDVPSAVIADFSPTPSTEAPRRRAASQSESDTSDPGGQQPMPSADEVKRGAHLKLVK